MILFTLITRESSSMWLHAALLLVALAVARAADEAFDVCIIGAGVAGLQAAATLQALAPKLSVCIVDGRERVGGRVHSVESQTHAGLFFEHGASWIHGIINNPIYALAQQHHITTIPTDWSKVNVSLGAGRWLTPFQVIGAFAEAELAWYAADAFAQRSAPVDFSVQAVYDNTSASPAWDVNVQAMLSVVVGAEEIDNAASAHEISGLYDTSMSEYEYQGDQVIFASGYSQIVGALAANASAARIILNATIVGVHDAGGARGVTLVAGDSRQFTAAHVISTLPLGVLKAGAVLFDPPLPAAKQAVIERMGFGSFHKTFLVFDRPFWEDRESCWLFHQSPTRNQTATRAFQYWLNMYSFTGVPFLIAVNIGDNARALFALDTPRVQALALEALGEMFSGDVPAPIEVAVNAWGSDPLAQGTYVFSKVGALPDDARVLGAAAGNVHFAGEATSFEHPGYVHGAFESGERAAREVLAAIGM